MLNIAKDANRAQILAISPEANDVELFEMAPFKNPDYYSIALVNLSKKWFPNEMLSFAYPMNYASNNQLSPTNPTRMFNTMLTAFKSILEKSPYICKRIGMTPNDVLDEYFYAEGEVISTSDFQRMFKEDTYNFGGVTFSSFKRTLMRRHNMLVRQGKLKGANKFAEEYSRII